MSSLDIGIDLGTSTLIAGTPGRGIIVHEPSVVAVKASSGNVIDIGKRAYDMVGRTPVGIKVVRPVEDGVVSNYGLTEATMRYLMEKVSRNHLIKPRVIVCIPSQITGVESQSVIDATVAAGARQVYLIEEPIAAAIGAGLDISKPKGRLIVDIGGGTTDVAVLSMNGVVCKRSLRVAGRAFEEIIIRHMRLKHNLLIGERTAEKVKEEIGNVYKGYKNLTTIVKGRGLLTGLPAKVEVNTDELYEGLAEVAVQIVQTVQNVLERTPPELAGDIRQSGLMMTGGGALLGGMNQLLENRLGIQANIAETTVENVAKGTIKAFSCMDALFDGFTRSSTHRH